jgi:hypothetical protein
MKESILCQGRGVSAAELFWLQSWVAQHCDWSRKRLARELCLQWHWYTSSGQIKNFAARSFLLKLQQRGLISLPPVRLWMRRPPPKVNSEPAGSMPAPAPINVPLSELVPLTLVLPTPGSEVNRRFDRYLATHHYLGFGGTVGENLKYLVRDRHGRDLACVLFGSAAWKTAPRDTFIGWNDAVRQRHLPLLTNNTRFLILPWVVVPHLASHILGCITRRLRADWQTKYAHPIYLVETFVQCDRFRGTSYRAANWIWVGQTQGRSRQDTHQSLRVPIKDIYLYPLVPHFREALCHVHP